MGKLQLLCEHPKSISNTFKAFSSLSEVWSYTHPFVESAFLKSIQGSNERVGSISEDIVP